jgi:hypothetical protein
MRSMIGAHLNSALLMILVAIGKKRHLIPFRVVHDGANQRHY